MDDKNTTEAPKFTVTSLSTTELETYTNLCDYMLSELTKKRTFSPEKTVYGDEYNKMFTIREILLDEVSKRLSVFYGE